MRKTLTILLLSVSAALYSQNQKIDPTVEVNRDYQGKMMEITKGKLATETADSLNSFHLDFNYSFFNKPYKDMRTLRLPRVRGAQQRGTAHPHTGVGVAGGGQRLQPQTRGKIPAPLVEKSSGNRCEVKTCGLSDFQIFGLSEKTPNS